MKVYNDSNVNKGIYELININIFGWKKFKYLSITWQIINYSSNHECTNVLFNNIKYAADLPLLV